MNALLTGGSFEGGANPINSDLFRRVRPRCLDCKEQRPDVPRAARTHFRRHAEGRRSRTMTASRRVAAIPAVNSRELLAAHLRDGPCVEVIVRLAAS